MELNEWVTASRKNARITQDQLAESLGVTRGNVSAWENGRHEPSVSQIKKIAEICSSDPALLFGGKTQSKDKEWPFGVAYALYAELPAEERQRINDLVEFSIKNWHSKIPARRKAS